MFILFLHANFARWEPGHGPFRFRHPWKMYLKVGNLTRDCAYKVEALNTYLNCKIQAPAEICGIIQEPCKRLKESCGRAQKPPQNKLVGRNRFTREIIPAASVASLLMEIIECIEKISEAVNELGKAASFRTSNATALPELPDSIQQETVQQDSNSTAILPVPHCVRVVVE
ncbi:hypothetical protein V6N12_066163 [Hibiscus sabdariffa]|uniref:Aluminum-activated malate transporter n=1 Tax=Hibiscus sabdariffa TaxID=183260 RepID=A0ABR2BAP8_9ROSI